MIEVDGEKLYTEAEWERRHRHVLKRQLSKGVVRCWRSPRGDEFAAWYREDQTRPWNQRELKAAARQRAKERARKHDEKIAQEARDRAESELLRRIAGGDVYYGERHTAYQWLAEGFVPIDEARWRVGNPHEGESHRYCYCQSYDVRRNPERAAELLADAPWQHSEDYCYDGLPWW